MTKLHKPIARETHATMFERSKSRSVIVTLEPPDMLAFRLKGTRRSFRLPAASCYRLAVRASVEAEKRERAIARKAKKGA